MNRAIVLVMVAVTAVTYLSCIRKCDKESKMISFATPWTSSFKTDSVYPHHLVNREGNHLLILNKTAWTYFTCADPEGVLQRAREQGVNVLRVCLEGTPYFEVLGMDGWPWGGTRENPDFSNYNEPYWDEVERRVRMAGEYGIGIDLNIYFTLRKEAEKLPFQQNFWDYTILRLGNYANILCWEIMNEYLGSENFQDSAGWYFYHNDPWKRPVITSDGTTENAAWPQKEWIGMAIVHTCTGSVAEYGLQDWYLGVARNTRAHGKPAFNNESGREIRHKNDDPIHRRKQAWIWFSAGCHWTWHSWEGCEGIDDAEYRGPGQEYMKPVTDFFRALPFWRMNPNYTMFNMDSPYYFNVTLAEPQYESSVVYLCTHQTGMQVPQTKAKIRIANGVYKVSFLDPATLNILHASQLKSNGLRFLNELIVPGFTDDVAIKFERILEMQKTIMKGTE